MKRFILPFLLFYCINSKIYGQEKPKIYLSGVLGNSIKISQLADTSIKITTDYKVIISGHTTVYFSGGGFKNVLSTTMTLGRPLSFSIGLKEKLIPGSFITLGGGHFFIDAEQTKRIYFEESSYQVVE